MSTCDIIIPVWNQPEITKECIDSVEENTSYPHKLIIIDNASGRETKEFLEGLERKPGPKICLIRNRRNEGFIKAINNGIARSEAEFVCILNNDTVVTRGWLAEMVKLFGLDPKIGIVNPSSNSLGQKLPKAQRPDERGSEIKNQSGLFVETGSAFGFCMLMRRALFGEIGRFDEVYGRGNFDDTDLSLRAKREGYKTVRAFASFVYHREQSSFDAVKSFEKDFRKNKKVFESRWGRAKRVIVISKNTGPDFLEYLKNVLEKYSRKRAWVYVISPFFETKEFFERFSNLSFYHYKPPFFYIKAALKTIFKKKRPDIIYSDNALFSNFLAALKPIHGAKVKSLREIRK